MSGSQPPVIDPRMLKLVITIGTTQYIYEDTGDITSPGLFMTAKGSKYANAIQNECTLTISNLASNEKNFILTETSPFNQNTEAKQMEVYAGRVSTGYALVFSGDITNVNATQPPDVDVIIKSATGQHLKAGVVGINRGAQAKLSAIAGGVANDLGLQLNFQASDKLISNHTYSGSQLGEVTKVGDLGNVNAYIDDNTLVVKDWNVPLKNTAVVVNETTGMIGIPELTEEGVQVTFLFNNITQLGGMVQLTSTNNPSLNGNYTISKLDFDLANRDTAFYFKALCINPQLSPYIAANGSGDDNNNSDGGQ